MAHYYWSTARKCLAIVSCLGFLLGPSLAFLPNLHQPSTRLPRSRPANQWDEKRRIAKSLRLHQTADRPSATVLSVEQQALRDELFKFLDATPANAPTSRDLTQTLLRVVQKLEDLGCPTPDDEVVTKLGGTWELLWTAQDRTSDQFNALGPFRTWINPLENQSYSNNPNGAEGRLNPVLPRPVQDQLERLGLIQVDEELSNVRSSQTIDVQRGRVRNVVTFAIPAVLPSLFSDNFDNNNHSNNPFAPRRASVTVDIDFTPAPNFQGRRVHVKFSACRIVVPKTPIDVTLPLGVWGPTGWLQTNYIDDSIRITRGHKGSVFVLKRPSAATGQAST